MSKFAAVLVAVVLGLLGFGAGIYFQSSSQPASGDAPGPAVAPIAVPKVELSGAVDGESSGRPPFEFTDQDGNARSIADWNGKVVVVNFWATWCAPCLEEIPLFVEAQDTLGPAGLQFVGVALDDSDKVKAFVTKMAMNYPTAHGQQNALDLMRAYGNKTGGLPFTAIVSREGNIVYRKAGIFTEEELAGLLQNQGLSAN